MTRRRLALLALFSATSLAFGPCGGDDPPPSDARSGDGKPATDVGGGSAKGSACVATCTTVADCPKGSTAFTYSCDGGRCIQHGCKADADCKVAILPHCIESSFATQCLPAGCDTKSACAGGEDCQLIFPGYKGCISGPVACTGDSDCTNGSGTFFSPGHAQCQDGYCGCVSDSGCQTAKEPLLGGTWKCLPWSGTFKHNK